jgi:hypothetical protein
MLNTPTNNPRNPNFCDACYQEISFSGECQCHNEGGWGWAVFHSTDEGEAE